MKRRFSLLVSAIAGCAILGAGAAHADQLADVKASGTLVCGVLDIFEPFGYTDVKNRSVVGYDVDVCEAISKKLGVKAEIKPVSIEARIPELQQKHMDLLSAGLAYTPQRGEQVAFSDAYYVSENVLAVKTSRDFKHTSELAGKRISYVKGSISEGYIKQALPTATTVGFEDVSTAFTALLQNKVVAFSTSEEVVQKLLSRLGDKAAQYAVLQPAIGREVWGLGIRKDEPAMLQAVNTALHELESSGEMQAIFDKWLGAQTLYKMQRPFKVEPIQ
ncbi:polar amino acid transport system substrate-binding protein [Pseudomonas sp. ok272]|uniref:transporter substrate-binding domain-containing protein n=1 Tax=unclassified Pseudomonas TaxID=196821 RepID=UPI0008CA4765|nr:MULTISPECIES: transporter substrate-binding domain-containing protein [unclassified Pseudomonas]SEM62138.1 polar amino acid transport system substrate-binding protein [Pseudomonas sp. ok272]SFM48056.1 polar amino acid transport system substrate-binding protein [Pseudomonas sp. ok602]